ncbi:unnamed protein product [Lupinus luteus]|uniref:Uncharacterized protein n=1 Tax=Lupinus luteus TaxID=3873 RepID=A0AAV1YKT8_LUPLU
MALHLGREFIGSAGLSFGSAVRSSLLGIVVSGGGILFGELDDEALADADIAGGEGGRGVGANEGRDGEPEEEGFEGFRLEKENGESEEKTTERNRYEEEWLGGIFIRELWLSDCGFGCS